MEMSVRPITQPGDVRPTPPGTINVEAQQVTTSTYVIFTFSGKQRMHAYTHTERMVLVISQSAVKEAK